MSNQIRTTVLLAILTAFILGLALGTGIIQFQDYLAQGLAHIPLLHDLSEEERWIVAR